VIGAAGADDIVGKLGAVELKTSEAKKILDAQNAQARLQLAASQANLDRFVRAQLVRGAVLAEALSAGWDKRPEVLEAINQARERIVTSAYLSDRAKPPADFPADAETKAFYAANAAQFTTPKQYRIGQIYLSAPDGSNPAKLAAAKKQAEEIAASLRSGADFAKLAQARSEDAQTASRGGEIGWMAENQLAPEIRAALSSLSTNQVSSPVKLPPGWHLLKLLGTKPGSLRPLDEVRDSIVAALRANRTRENAAKYADEIVRKTPPEINEIELSKLWKSIH
jgi:peptidylprolyl isomerase